MTTEETNGGGFFGNRDNCEDPSYGFLANRNLIIASNRGPVSIKMDENGELHFQRSGGGLVTALSGLAQQNDSVWIASAQSETEQAWGHGDIHVREDGPVMKARFLTLPEDSFQGYYNVIANPLLWFLQHNMLDTVHAPNIDRATWNAWDQGYVEVNRIFANAIVEEIKASPLPSIVMLQDYHLYLAPRFIRQQLSKFHKPYILNHFVHIPWPGTEDWGLLPPRMRLAILEGLCSVDLLGFQTQEDGLNFIRSCETYMPRARVKFRHGRIWYRNHATYVHDFPISIDVQSLRSTAETEEVAGYREQLLSRFGDSQLIVRIDRLEPSKNIARGFQAFGELLEMYPEHLGKVQFLALLVPSRLGVDEYQDYLRDVMTAAGQINATYGDYEWEPVRIFIGENYPRAVAAMQIYDVLLVNSIADGMNLVAKEGPSVNQRDGVVILSERTGARQQLEVGALIISPCDLFATAESMHQALLMQPDERHERAERLRTLVEREDIHYWLCQQLDYMANLNL